MLRYTLRMICNASRFLFVPLRFSFFNLFRYDPVDISIIWHWIFYSPFQKNKRQNRHFELYEYKFRMPVKQRFYLIVSSIHETALYFFFLRCQEAAHRKSRISDAGTAAYTPVSFIKYGSIRRKAAGKTKARQTAITDDAVRCSTDCR